MFETYTNYIDFFTSTIAEFGGVGRTGNKYILRKYVTEGKNGDFPASGAYFGCINIGEDNSGVYSDTSIVIFPSNEENDSDDKWLISLITGSGGYKNDYEIITLPGTKRGFVKHVLPLGHSFVKNDFLDIEGQDGFKAYCGNEDMPSTLMDSYERYGSVILACSAFKPSEEENAKRVIKTYLALYGKLIRSWDKTKKDAAKNIDKILESKSTDHNDYKNAKSILNDRHYLVLQGAPGTGKTRLAKKLTNDTYDENIFFTQFHAETTYADFIYGITPVLSNASQLQYQANDGIFVKAIKKAQNTQSRVYLIIDEINRANLSNVLGQAFYLFEPLMDDSNIKISLTPSLNISKLPKNLFVIATMNTADRSLAVVDFALRRRFAWYTIFPHNVTDLNANEYFAKSQYDKICSIFEKYANDEELNLQPGHAYFIVNDADNPERQITMRIKYELMPLIKEYLNNGLLTRAKDDFADFFRNEIGEEMYK